MEALKNWYGPGFYKSLAALLLDAGASVDENELYRDFTRNLESLELKQRIDRTITVLRKHLPSDFRAATHLLQAIAPKLETGFFGVFIPDFVGRYGADDFDFSLDVLRDVTQYSTSEFAVREFLRRDFERTRRTMINWSQHDNHHVRRLASEGLRPRLPWSFKLPEVIHRPELSEPVLNELRNDTSEYVRKSVANHINDISKDNPDFALSLLESWDRSSAATRWIVKHAARSLIKDGNGHALALFGFEREPNVAVQLLNKTDPVHRGETFVAGWRLISHADHNQKLLVDYAILYAAKSGQARRKVFKLREVDLAPGAFVDLTCSTAFRDLTTRKHYSGTHRAELQVNGRVLHSADFEFVG